MADRISVTPASPALVAVSPVPSDEEAAALVAAIEAMWPGQAGGPGVSNGRPSAWKFSGRWWSQPIPLRRARPWT
ncbi:hypothetical protein [Desertimonas flava]|uniref:hypothetical protein n=1 Tax=Desertimonas flava TaxID=2064846 RepID=UPI0013C44FAF|nr:hypothetical protein [Desertimonas flava]